MDSTTKTDTADVVLRVPRSHEAELRAAGLRRLSLFGSVARGEDAADSDVDLVTELDPGMDAFRLFALERRIGELLGRKVDLVPEPVEKVRLQANILRDRLVAY